MFGPGARQQDLGQLRNHLVIGQPRSPLFCHNDYLNVRQPVFMAAEKLPQQALHPIAPGGLAYFAPHHQPQSRAPAFSGRQANAEMRRMKFFSLNLNPEVFLTPAKPLVPTEATRLARGRAAFAAARLVGRRKSARQRFPAFRPSDVCGPWPGVAATPGARPWCSYGSESHGFEPGASCSAEKSVS